MNFIPLIVSKFVYGFRLALSNPSKLYRFVIKCHRQGYLKTFRNFLTKSYSHYENEFDLSKRKFIILTTPHCLIIARQLKFLLEKIGFKCDITQNDSDPLLTSSGGIPIILAPQMFSRLPEKFIAFQLEQKRSRWFTRDYLSILSKAAFILEFSKKNIEFLHNSGFPFSKIYYCPILPNSFSLANFYNNKENKEFDLVFYGALNTRRKKILDSLSKKFKILVLSELFGEELYCQISRARLLINIHFYEDADLETTRITEAISLGIPIVSESSSEEIDTFYSDYVVFAQPGNLPELEEKIKFALNRENHFNDVFKKDEFSWFNFYFLRFLLAQDLITFENFKDFFISCFPRIHHQICLSLPESLDRSQKFSKQPSSTLFTLFPGLRHNLGNIGCAYSYKFIFCLALRQQISQMCICEDDVRLPNDFEKTLQIINNFLKINSGSWDVFSGLVSDYSNKLKILKKENYYDLTFIFMNEACGLVFSIFSDKAITKLSTWKTDRNIMDNSMDRFMSKELDKFITTLPFIVGHDESVSSTIWDGNNKDLYHDYISISEDKLKSKVAKLNKKNRYL